MLFFYACFFIGWRTRAFHVVSLACVVSLDARNILLEGAGSYATIALLAFTAFLPLGSRFSLDSLLASMAARDEKSAAMLNDRPRPDAAAVDAARAPGWTPTSIAALAVLAQIAVIYLAMALQQKGAAWSDGSALYYALNSERWVSGAGASARAPRARRARRVGARVPHRRARHPRADLPPVRLAPHARRRRRARPLHRAHARDLLRVRPLGWTLAASSRLLVPPGTWDRVAEHPRARRARTVIYDVDCGVCLWLSAC